MDVKKPKIVEKPWGREIWVAENKKYAGKILEIKKGTRTSLHYHKVKEETMYVFEGEMRVRDKDDREKVVKKGESITLKPNEVHRLYAVEDLKILEVSTPQLDDVVRVADDYGR
jgi:quercetin dioxygenase-like cupin family protein